MTFPLSYIGSDNVQGGFIACSALADALGEGADIYIQNVRPGISTTDQREEGCVQAAEERGLNVVRVDYNDNSASPNTPTNSSRRLTPNARNLPNSVRRKKTEKVMAL